MDNQAEEYQKARMDLLAREKEATRLLSSLAAARRTLPMVHITNPSRFKFDTESGEQTLPELFAGRRQLILYHFMLGPPHGDEGCTGCSFCMDHVPDLHHLWSRDTSFVAAATASVERITSYAKRLGWNFPFVSSAKTHREWERAEADGETITWKPRNGYFGFSAFYKDGEEVYHTYDTTDRGVEMILSTYHLLDMTRLGRQETGNGMGMFLRNDEYS
ncbi:hypothetical protein EYZ11_000026 [Aspergillus tanneri]|uniref:DUF899-domain-containing protein n=1 Tax=Aspergillus tanneri TaxID=1220188 RepID=A0A4S3JY20_9EURO|nr:uncharacterized protein ATNIH1004_000599 [Aspergillus tanneri]KAA8651703.1 hypothetical protein ATNIH1004_000599 [Aspergillus tanneri]THD00462.1 hypothetical protein EYZ11_000026 [Aspergillus tanneri]